MTNYNKMSKKRNKETGESLEKIDEIIPQAVEVAEPVVESSSEPMFVEGAVSGCDQMYVREEPSTDGAPLGIIKIGTKVKIYESESTDDFYSVCTETGLEGFCMKKFISVI